MNAERAELWNTTEVAKFLGVKPGTVSAYRHRGQMPAPVQTLGARTHLWDADTIRAWRAQRRDGTDLKHVDAPRRSDPHEWLVHGERDLCSLEWIRVSLVYVEPSSDDRFEHHVVTMPSAAMVAILDTERRHVGLMWQHRFAPNIWNWELPGGHVESGDDPAETARREAIEEPTPARRSVPGGQPAARHRLRRLPTKRSRHEPGSGTDRGQAPFRRPVAAVGNENAPHLREQVRGDLSG